MRILHFSDVHLREPAGDVPLRDWLGKRLLGGLNLLLGRARHFADAGPKVAALDRLRREQAIDLVLCTGDYTALGTRGELALAREAVGPLMETPLGYVHVPGNHDLYVPDAVRERRFESAFGDTFRTDLPELAVEGGSWPFVRFVGEEVCVAAVNSARPNPQPWRSSGRIPEAQLEALGRILREERVRKRFVFVMTHYAPRLADGRPDARRHGLVNANAFLDVCRDLSPGAILCGHVHWRYAVRAAGVRPWILCAGSATKRGREGIWVYDVEAERARATPGAWVADRYVLDPASTIDLLR